MKASYSRDVMQALYDNLGRLRDECIEMRDRMNNAEAYQQYDGRAVAYDTVCGIVFKIIGEADESEEETE